MSRSLQGWQLLKQVTHIRVMAVTTASNTYQDTDHTNSFSLCDLTNNSVGYLSGCVIRLIKEQQCCGASSTTDEEQHRPGTFMSQ
jgi:hypothetical protein